MPRILAGAAAVFGFAMASAAQPGEGEQEHARARLVAEHSALVPGTTAWVGLAFEIEPEWHLYWNGLNDTGFPVSVEVSLPDGYKAGEVLWPAPKRHIADGDLLDHIYEDEVTLLIPVEVPADAKPGSKATIGVESEWLVCKSACVPGSASVSITLPVAEAGTAPEKTKDAPLFERSRARLPKPLKDSDPVKIAAENERLTVTAPGAARVAFYPGPECGKIENLIRNGEAKGETLRLPFGEASPRVQGILEVHPVSGGRSQVYWLDWSGSANPGGGRSSNRALPDGSQR